MTLLPCVFAGAAAALQRHVGRVCVSAAGAAAEGVSDGDCAAEWLLEGRRARQCGTWGAAGLTQPQLVSRAQSNHVIAQSASG